MLSYRPIQMMNMLHATTTINDTVMRKKTGLRATGNRKETRVRQEMTETVREIIADIDRAAGLMTRLEVIDPMTESVYRPKNAIDPDTIVTEIGMITGTDYVASIRIVEAKGGVNDLDHGTDLRIVNMTSPPEVDTSTRVKTVIGKDDHFNFVLYNIYVCFSIGTDLTATHQVVTMQTIIVVIKSVVTKEVVTEEAAESTIVVKIMRGSDVKGTSRMIWHRIHTFRKGILTIVAATMTSSKEKVRKLRATYFGMASNGFLANVKRPISTPCKNT